MPLRFKNNIFQMVYTASFANWALEQLQADPNFGEQIIFIDEEYFRLNGYVNNQNCRIWDDDKSQQFQELPLHTEKLAVWCGL